MSEVFKSIKKGLEEAVEYSKGNLKSARVFIPQNVDVKTIRSQVGMTQEEFSVAFGISLGTLRHWERGDRTPQGPALILLNLVKKEPKTILRVLSQ
jgi:putative transcriptional regulator